MFTYIPLCIAITSEEQLNRTMANLKKSDKVKNIRIDGDKIKYEQLTWENEQMKNLNFCIATLEAGGYMAYHKSQVTSGYGSGLIGVGLHNKEGRCLLTDCKAEFNHIKEIVKLREVPWKEGHASGIEYYLED